MLTCVISEEQGAGDCGLDEGEVLWEGCVERVGERLLEGSRY